MKAQLVKRQDRFDLYNESDGSKIASTLPNPMGKLSLKNCQAIENGYDLDELADEYSDGWDAFTDDRFDAYKEGFQKALSILGDKKFSEEDMVNMFFLGRESLDKALVTEQEAKIIVKSKEQTEFDVEIEMEEVYDGLDEMAQKQYRRQPKLDANGCIILKRK